MLHRARRSAVAMLACAAQAAGAHALAERYELPLPLGYVVAGVCAAVLLTFVLAAFFARAGGGSAREQRLVPLPGAAVLLLRSLSLLLFAVTIAAALWGTQDPLMNLAPTMVWIVAWLGLTFTSAFIVNPWPVLDPWRSLHLALLALAPPLRRDGLLRWPLALGCWPAVALLLACSWLEIVYPIAMSPRKMGWLLLAWSAITLAGMVAFGRRTWQAHGDVFALAFTSFGRLPRLRLRLADPEPERATPGLVGFVMALLATVIFDGLHGSSAWHGFEAMLARLSPVPLDVNGYVAGTMGLLLVWLAFVLLFETALRGADAKALRIRLALTLLPIAAGYAVAHNLSAFVLQGQRVFSLLSDPFGRQWDLFGTAAFYPDIAFIDARVSWFIAVGAILAGHAASIWWSHRVVLAAGMPRQRAAVALAPLTALMIGYTGVSLLLLAAGE